MELIDKAAIMAEIERRRDYYKRNPLLVNAKYCIDEDNAILKLLDTLEVKDVDLEKEFFDWYHKESTNDYNASTLYERYSTISKKLAKHFFELGLKAKGEKL